MTAPPRDAPPETAHAAARQLSHLILEGEWAHHLRAIGTPLSFDRTPYALDADVEDVEQLRIAYVLWLACSRRSQPQIQRASEALALLQLVRELDPAHWLTTLESLWPNEFKDPDQRGVSQEDLLTMPMTMGLPLHVETTVHMEWVFERVVGSTPFSSRYHADFGTIQEALGEYAHRATVTRIPVSLKVYSIDRLELRTVLHEQFLQIAIMQHRFIQLTRWAPRDPLQPIQGKQERTCFQVVELDLDGPALQQLRECDIEYFGRIAAHGVRLTRLTTLKLEGELRPATTQALQSLFSVGGHPRRQYFGVEEVKLSASDSLDMIAPMLSALQVSQSVRKVTIEMGCPEMMPNSYHIRTFWQWITYGLFSKHALHNIQEVELDMEFFQETDLADFEAAVTNPLEGLVHSALRVDLDQSDQNQYVEASRFYVERHFKLYPLPIGALTAARVIATDENEQVDFWSAPSATYEGNNTSFKLLTLTNCTLDNENVNYALLRAVTCPVESIEFIDEHFYTLHGGNCFEPVVTSFPGLKQLITPSGFVDSPLMDLAELAVDGKCGLEVLHVSGWSNLRKNFYLIPFIEVLADVGHPLSRNLRELELHVTDGEPENSLDSDTSSESDDERDNTPEFVAAMHKMLARNRRLHTFTLHLLDFEDEDPIGWPDEQVAIRTAPLALSSKLALLSISSGSKSALTTVAKSLDSAVLSIVFEFAAEHRIRRVNITR